jgi:hypothetical protein
VKFLFFAVKHDLILLGVKWAKKKMVLDHLVIQRYDVDLESLTYTLRIQIRLFSLQQFGEVSFFCGKTGFDTSWSSMGQEEDGARPSGYSTVRRGFEIYFILFFDILERIRIRGSVPLTKGSSSKFWCLLLFEGTGTFSSFFKDKKSQGCHKQ